MIGRSARSPIPARSLPEGTRAGTTTPAARAPTTAGAIAGGATPVSTRTVFSSAGSTWRAIVRSTVRMGPIAGAGSASSLTRLSSSESCRTPAVRMGRHDDPNTTHSWYSGFPRNRRCSILPRRLRRPARRRSHPASS
ncbi:zinc finger CCCH domain-containing protein 2 [Phtheirospermum japonicum]|uniref:Zinc finger CCCH domain-containing protein 2 n=1 Tax=Phtheirospermum japonicum TaxID=374723 RepID=A0A830DA82_9LAMI|nr:zinc finger CCCH domain-containing protein 2 [Phtheirospermum japonicum]